MNRRSSDEAKNRIYGRVTDGDRRRHRQGFARRQRISRSSSETRPTQYSAASKPPTVQTTGQYARIAALSMLTASPRDYPRSIHRGMKGGSGDQAERPQWSGEATFAGHAQTGETRR